MSYIGRCIKTCTTPIHGLVEKHQEVPFDNIDTWDEGVYPFLKHFEVVEGTGDYMPPADKDILAAIELLDVNEDKHWTDAGLPAMAAIENALSDDRILRADINRVAPGLTREGSTDPEEKQGFFSKLKELRG